MMFKWLTGGITKSIENIATEWIETDKDRAEAKTLMIRALDPNGKMRRDISLMVCNAYMIYLFIGALLVFMQMMGFGSDIIVEGKKYNSVAYGVETVKALFADISTAFGVIVASSFGVNLTNVMKGN
jgi:hypothetical protein